jgi:hypothetical protein|tara:strand:+ start:196 stop:1029 length:834 start_codon:yes stop_codon:yes gene_type:complete
MKKILFILLLTLSFPVLNYSQNTTLTENHTHPSFGIEWGNEINNTKKVYICTGEYAYAYHNNANCNGLSNCKGDIKYTNENYAVQNLERKPCCICIGNTNSNNCKNDNPTYARGGGGADDAAAYLGVALVAFSAVILSNDIYIYHINNFNNTAGFSLGFRKTFNNSALEYGFSKVRSTYIIYNNKNEYDFPGWNINYTHDIYKNNTPYWLTPFIGPSINYMSPSYDGYEFGYGGVIGTKMRLSDRFDFDIRYEYTTNTNRLSAGFIYTYQKKYFWKK